MEETINKIIGAEKHVETKLARSLKIFSGIILVMVVVVLHKIYLHQIGAMLALVGLGMGMGIGFFAGRMFKIYWHLETQKVVSRMDKIGIVILVLYVIVEIGRKWFFGHWMEGAQLNAFGLAFLAGLLSGRLLSILNNIKNVLLEEKKIK